MKGEGIPGIGSVSQAKAFDENRKLQSKNGQNGDPINLFLYGISQRTEQTKDKVYSTSSPILGPDARRTLSTADLVTL